VTQPPDPDNLDWNVERDGRMRDHATAPEDEPETVPYEGDEDVDPER
jgi:hypothetical protein